MAGNTPHDDQDEFIFASKRAIFVGVLIILVLLIYIMVENIENLPPDKPSQSALLPQNVPVKQEVVHQVTPQPASPPARDTQEVDVGFRVSGRIAEMFFAEHAEVKQGDILASLDQTPFEEALASAMAQLRAAQANYTSHLPTSSFNAIESARADVETAQHTYDVAHAELEKRGGLLIAGQLDNVYNDDVQDEHDTKLNLERIRRESVQQQNIAANNPDRDDDKAAIQIARNNVASAEANLADTQLLAPAAGIIVSRVSEVGATVPAGAAVYTLSVPRTAVPNP